MGPDYSRTFHFHLRRAMRERVDRTSGRPTHPHHNPFRPARVQAQGLSGGGHDPVVHGRHHRLQ